MNPRTQMFCHRGAVISLLALVVLCVAWELALAPLRPGGSWLALKAVPLLLPLAGIVKRDVYTMQWSSMLILLYFCEGIVRATSDKGASATLGWIETGLTLLFFVFILSYLHPVKRAAKKLAREAINKASHERIS